MNAIERKRYILDELQRNGSVVITDLAERIQVSPMTIRRDLNAMAEDGMVTLEHGGAVLNNGSLFECGISFKSEINAAEKKRIAAKCMEYINEGDSIFLDTGTTPNELAMLLRGKRNISVLTHSLLVANTAATMRNIKLIMCPGEFRENSMGFLGPLTDDFIQCFQIDTLFLSLEGIDLNDGISVVDVQDGHTKKVLVEKAKRVICMADHTKFNKSFFYKIAPITDVDLVVTDTGLDEATQELFRQNNIPLALA